MSTKASLKTLFIFNPDTEKLCLDKDGSIQVKIPTFFSRFKKASSAEEQNQVLDTIEAIFSEKLPCTPLSLSIKLKHIFPKIAVISTRPESTPQIKRIQALMIQLYRQLKKDNSYVEIPV